MAEKKPPVDPKPVLKNAGPPPPPKRPRGPGKDGSDPVEPPGGGGGQVKGDIVD